MAAAKRLSSDIGTPAMAQMIRRGWIDDTPEIRDVWEQFRADRNAADFQRLVQHYSPMVLHIVMRERKRLPSLFVDGVDENLSDGLAAMMRWFMHAPASMTIAGTLFWARKAIRCQVCRAALKAERHRQTRSLDAPLGDDDLPLHQTVAIDTPAPFTPILDAEFVALVMRGLDRREKKIIRLMMRGHNGAEIGNALGVSRQRAHQLIDRVFGELRKRKDLARYESLCAHSRGPQLSGAGIIKACDAVPVPGFFLKPARLAG